MKKPLFSVVIPAYNCADTIARALDSVERAVDYFYDAVTNAHEYSCRVIVVDDCSADDTFDAVRRWDERKQRVILLRLSENRGAGSARNAGAALAVGEYLFFLDADDEYLPQHILCCLIAMKSYPDAGIVKTGVLLDREILPEWVDEIEGSLVHNACIRLTCHRFIGGFMEDAELKVLTMEDCFYNGLISHFFNGYKIAVKTLHHKYRKGNSFDRQLEKFRKPVVETPDGLTPEQADVYPGLWKAFVERRKMLESKMKNPWSGPPFKACPESCDTGG